MQNLKYIRANLYMNNTILLKDSICQLKKECRSMIDTCKKEVREMTNEEQEKFNDIKSKIEERKKELDALEKELASETKKEEKNTRNNTMKNTSLVKEIRNALENNIKNITIPAETRAVQVQGENGVHDEVIETEIQGILEPLYANSVLAQLGVRFYPGLPHGDVQIPIMSKSNVGWVGEINAASATSNTFTTVKLSPKRLSAYVDISKQLLVQDTIGVEAAIRRDIVNALNDKLEATILGKAAGDTNKPAGIFNGKTLTSVSSFEDLCDLEATVENANFNGEMKYLLSTGAKAALRAMAKSSKSTQLVLEGGEVDGTPIVVTSNVEDDRFVYGDFSNIVVGSWGDIEITIDEYTQAINGCVRLVINAYFDEAITREAGLAFAQIGE